MSKGVFIEGITVEMLRNTSLEAVEELMNNGDMVDLEVNQTEQDEYQLDGRDAMEIARRLTCDFADADRDIVLEIRQKRTSTLGSLTRDAGIEIEISSFTSDRAGENRARDEHIKSLYRIIENMEKRE